MGAQNPTPVLHSFFLPNHNTVRQHAPDVTAIETETSTSKDKIKFLLLEGIHPSAVAVIQAAGYPQIESTAGALSGEAL